MSFCVGTLFLQQSKDTLVSQWRLSGAMDGFAAMRCCPAHAFEAKLSGSSGREGEGGVAHSPRLSLLPNFSCIS